MGRLAKFAEGVRSWLESLDGRGSDSVLAGADTAGGNPVTQVVAQFLNRYQNLAGRIDKHLRYDKEFGGAGTMVRSLQDPFSPEEYAAELHRICGEIERRNGARVNIASPGQPRATIETAWLIVAQVLYPAREAIRMHLKEQIRVELAGHLLVSRWRDTNEPFGGFIRRHHELVYQTPSEALDGITPDELMRLFKSAALVADKAGASAVVASAGGMQSGGRRHSPEFFLGALVECIRLPEKSRLDRIMRGAVRGWIGVAVMVVIAAVVFTIPVELISGITLPPTASRLTVGQWEAMRLGFTLALAMLAAFRVVLLIVRRIRRRSYCAAFRFLIGTGLVSRAQAEHFLATRYGSANTRKLLAGTR